MPPLITNIMAVITYKCPNCGGPLAWDADKKKYSCEYCNSVFVKEDLDKLNPESAEASKAENAQSGESDNADNASESAAGERAGESAAKKPALMHYTCPSCGAEIMTDETTAASFCYYCHNPVVLSDRLEGDKLPDVVIPFAISREKAEEIFSDWVKKHKYIPSGFFDKDKIDSVTGVYFPYWIYRCTANVSMSGEAKSLRVWIAGDMQFTETSIYDISRSGVMGVSDMARVALKKANKVLCESVMPFDLSKAETFSDTYLQGYMAEIRDIDRDGISEEARTAVKQIGEQQLKNTVSGDYSSVTVQSSSADIKDENWQYALMPVWTVTYNDKGSGRVYYFSVNGQSGETCGELPVDKGKLRRLFLCVFIPVFVIVLALLFFV